jgi:hypothetical protein
LNQLDFDRGLIGHRNDELSREVQQLRLEERLQANRRSRSGRLHTNNLTSRSALSLLRVVGLSE